MLTQAESFHKIQHSRPLFWICNFELFAILNYIWCLFIMFLVIHVQSPASKKVGFFIYFFGGAPFRWEIRCNAPQHGNHRGRKKAFIMEGTRSSCVVSFRKLHTGVFHSEASIMVTIHLVYQLLRSECHQKRPGTCAYWCEFADPVPCRWALFLEAHLAIPKHKRCK